MKVFVPREVRDGEKRVALVPHIISKLVRAGLEVAIQSGAGVASGAADTSYTDAGARIVADGSVDAELRSADVILSVQPLSVERFRALKSGAITISFLAPSLFSDAIDAAAQSGVTAISLELVPRISRAQSMDALTSQALCAGYKAALVGAELSPRFFPL